MSKESRAAMERRVLEVSRPAFRHMNTVLDEYRAGRATYADYQAAWDEFERVAREAQKRD